MSDRKWDTWNEPAFDALLAESLTEMPPEDIIAGVNPCRKALRRVLVGLGLSTFTLQFFYLQYLLTAIGMVMMLLGFRTLRKENKWFAACFAIAGLRAGFVWLVLICNTTLLPERLGTGYSILGTAVSLGLLFALLFSFWRALRAVKIKAGLAPGCGGAVALMVWYGLLCLLALIGYQGFILAGLMVVGYVFIIRSLVRLYRTMDKAGYAIEPTPVRVPDRAAVAVLSAVLLLGCALGYLLGGSYPMDWKVLDTAEHQDVEAVKANLLELGFPEYVLNDLSAADIAACAGALQVVYDVNDHPVNEGREVIEYQDGDPYLLREPGYYRTTVYDVRELRITGVAVQLPNERESWMIFQHFLWTEDPGFYGTESIQLWPAYRHSEGWGEAGAVSGRVLYDKGDKTYTAPYYFLGRKTYTANHVLWGESVSTDVFAAFSLPDNGQNQRGYLAYPIVEMQDGYIADCWFNYTHQQRFLQYPVMSAMQKRMQDSWREAGAFLTIWDALQFYNAAGEASLLSDN